MTLEAVSAIAALPAAPAAATAVAPGGQAFGAWVEQGLQSVNTALVKADGEVRQAALGGGPALHEVMLHLEEARLSFQLLAQVRNRVLEAYQDVMRTQV